MNVARLLHMSPAEVGNRVQQAIAKRWASPPPCRLIPSAETPSLPDLPPLDSPAAAEKIRRHRFDLLGYRDLDFGTPIDWHLDPVHNKRAPRLAWYDIPFLDFDRVGDHKIIWELNRHQHLVTLAQAGFRDEVLTQWTHWQAENIYPVGINWASTLEVAFRALSWLWVRQLLGDFHRDLLPSLHLHGWYIERFLSTYFSPNTHLLGEAVALFAIGTMCPTIASAARWRNRGWQIILEQSENQVRPDGFHFEQSVYYHVYALDFFTFARDLAARNSLPVPPLLEQTIARMEESLTALSVDGRTPNFGDDDGGHVITASLRRPSAGGSSISQTGGIHIMNSRGSKLFIDAGPQGAFAGGHGHADALSLQLILPGGPVLIDPGTFCYVCPERDRFRGTAAHNTVQIDGRDQAVPNGPFAWKNMPETVVDRWYAGDAYDFFAGRHNGYTPVIHHRSVFNLKDKFWLVRDKVTGPLNPRLDIHWHYLELQELSIIPPSGHTWSERRERWDWSPVYGRQEPASVLRFGTQSSLPVEFAVVLVAGPAGTLTSRGPGSYLYKEPQGSEHRFEFIEDRFTYRCAGSGQEFCL